jgi:hypothetical protein
MSRKPRALTIRVAEVWKRKWVRITAIVVGLPALALFLVAGYYYIVFARLIDDRISGERDRVLPRVFARPLELRRGQSLTEAQLVDRLNDLGYAQRLQAQKPGEFAMDAGAVSLRPRTSELQNRTARVVFVRPTTSKRASTAKPRVPDRVEQLEIDGKPVDRLTLDAPLLSSMVAQREKRRPVALAA